MGCGDVLWAMGRVRDGRRNGVWVVLLVWRLPPRPRTVNGPLMFTPPPHPTPQALRLNGGIARVGSMQMGDRKPSVGIS